jgi:hypothetical protein
MFWRQRRRLTFCHPEVTKPGRASVTDRREGGCGELSSQLIQGLLLAFAHLCTVYGSVSRVGADAWRVGWRRSVRALLSCPPRGRWFVLFTTCLLRTTVVASDHAWQPPVVKRIDTLPQYHCTDTCFATGMQWMNSTLSLYTTQYTHALCWIWWRRADWPGVWNVRLSGCGKTTTGRNLGKRSMMWHICLWEDDDYVDARDSHRTPRISEWSLISTVDGDSALRRHQRGRSESETAAPAFRRKTVVVVLGSHFLNYF